jgi:hypothetical protein
MDAESMVTAQKEEEGVGVMSLESFAIVVDVVGELGQLAGDASNPVVQYP